MKTYIKVCLGSLTMLVFFVPSTALGVDIDSALHGLINGANTTDYVCTCCDDSGCKRWSGPLTDTEKEEAEKLGCDKEPGSVLENELLNAVLGEDYSPRRGARAGDEKWECEAATF